MQCFKRRCGCFSFTLGYLTAHCRLNGMAANNLTREDLLHGVAFGRVSILGFVPLSLLSFAPSVTCFGRLLAAHLLADAGESSCFMTRAHAIAVLILSTSLGGTYISSNLYYAEKVVFLPIWAVS